MTKKCEKNSFSSRRLTDINSWINISHKVRVKGCVTLCLKFRQIQNKTSSNARSAEQRRKKNWVKLNRATVKHVQEIISAIQKIWFIGIHLDQLKWRRPSLSRSDTWRGPSSGPRLVSHRTDQRFVFRVKIISTVWYHLRFTVSDRTTPRSESPDYRH